MYHTSLWLFIGVAATRATDARFNLVSVTPHDRYSSSIGVLGCKVDTNRIAYWPSTPSCNNLCVKVNANGRAVYLLQIDQSEGAYDISYDAWNYLLTGKSAREYPISGGDLTASYENVPMSYCASAIKEDKGRLAFSAANSMNFLMTCSPESWIAHNHALYNIVNPACTWGFNEECVMPPPDQGNQPACSHQLGSLTLLSSEPVYNLDYMTGKISLAQ
ncbi:hypothetical protein NPX13_g11452 [Xylaria arbuscula]|uniref:Cerato-platanin n=1 Tax=Xylaria arbuscula TaxID=114810 RepID=A0A9W8TFK2_9PEZI|nr:hypothetical protein NPX13_g11452 [Xylaria arbuscula]